MDLINDLLNMNDTLSFLLTAVPDVCDGLSSKFLYSLQ